MFVGRFDKYDGYKEVFEVVIEVGVFVVCFEDNCKRCFEVKM